jgi:hypothetical protein
MDSDFTAKLVEQFIFINFDGLGEKGKVVPVHGKFLRRWTNIKMNLREIGLCGTD